MFSAANLSLVTPRWRFKLTTPRLISTNDEPTSLAAVKIDLSKSSGDNLLLVRFFKNFPNSRFKPENLVREVSNCLLSLDALPRKSLIAEDAFSTEAVSGLRTFLISAFRARVSAAEPFSGFISFLVIAVDLSVLSIPSNNRIISPSGVPEYLVLIQK